VYTTLGETPRARVVWHPLRHDQALPPAPLVHSLVESRLSRKAAILIGDRYSHLTEPHFDDRVITSLTRRLNAFAQLEISLWWFARNGGHLDPPPYTVRYDLARWFWHPSIGGTIFCLRCGQEIQYRRSSRRLDNADRQLAGARTARCRACSRGRVDEWPTHAREPYGRGTWLLQCTAGGCTELFVGQRQARFCEAHRLNRITPTMRAGRG
jgi:hypothetical protein